jgi:hypothetical protein
VRHALLVCLAALTAGLAGCGGGSSSGPGGALADTAKNLGDIRSGDLTLEILASSGESRAGFTLKGPFAFAESADALPKAELEYTQIAGSQNASTTFVSTGDKAFVKTDAGTFELSDAQVASLRGSGASGGDGSGGLDELRIESWFVNPKVTDGGDGTDTIHSDLDVVAAANGLMQLTGGLGTGAGGQLEGRSAEQLRQAVGSATIDVWTGKEDRLLRRLVIALHFEAKPPPELEGLFRNVAPADFRLELGIARPNEQVTVEEPANAQPLPTQTG